MRRDYSKYTCNKCGKVIETDIEEAPLGWFSFRMESYEKTRSTASGCRFPTCNYSGTICDECAPKYTKGMSRMDYKGEVEFGGETMGKYAGEVG